MSSGQPWMAPGAEQLERLTTDERDAQDFVDYMPLWIRQASYAGGEARINRRIKDHLVRDWQVPRLPGRGRRSGRERYASGIPWSKDARHLLLSPGPDDKLAGRLVFEHVRPLKNTVAELRASYVDGEGRDAASMLALLRRLHTGWCFAVVSKRDRVPRAFADGTDPVTKFAEVDGGAAGFLILADDPRFGDRDW
ncbi:hypothetical protein [Microbacterium sp. NPDC077184]|uniref:hypothetical protein n=1 Tax=Microbacterium sp. NPDC077184 TaxID=3154764 RepID=UPI00341C8DD5